jgi:hypothetical protein
MCHPGCRSRGVMESSTILFHLRVVLVFRDIIHVIIVLYSWHLVICEHFLSICVEQLIMGIHIMSTWFWHKNRVWQNRTGINVANITRLIRCYGMRRWRTHTQRNHDSKEWAKSSPNCWHFLCSSTSTPNCQCSTSQGVFSRYRIYIFPWEEGSLSCKRLTLGVSPLSTTRLYRCYVN